MKYSRAISRVRCVCVEPTFRGPSRSSSSGIPDDDDDDRDGGIWSLVMTDSVLEMSVQHRHLTRLITREDFIEFSRHGRSRTFFM